MNLDYVNIDDIIVQEGEHGLRAVQKDSPGYKQIVNTIPTYGILLPLVVKKHPEQKNKFLLVDGHQRFAAAQECSLKQVPVQISDISNDDIHFAQIVANMAKVETKPVQYSNQIRRILLSPVHKNISRSELMRRIGFKESLATFNNIVRLGELVPEAVELVDKDLINLSNAYALSQLPAEEQVHWLDRAQEGDKDFIPDVQKRVSELKKEAKGETSTIADPLDSARRRTMTEIKEKYLSTEQELNDKSLSNRDFTLGFHHALQWTLKIDEDTQKAKTEEENRKKAERELILAARKKLQEEAQAKAKSIKISQEEIDKQLATANA
jgi:ParB/RepB/Spo0J family partition protein